jgi:hypothetical protein
MTTQREKPSTEIGGNGGAMPFPAFRPVADAYMAFWKQAGEIQLEMLRFISERLEKDMAYSNRLLGCKNADELLKANSEFCTCFFDDYLKEGRKIGEFVNTAAKESQRGLEQGNGGARRAH